MRSKWRTGFGKYSYHFGLLCDIYDCIYTLGFHVRLAESSLYSPGYFAASRVKCLVVASACQCDQELLLATVPEGKIRVIGQWNGRSCR